MDLYATGFNAWNQLAFEPCMIQDNPDDLFTFTKVLSAQALENPIARLSHTSVQRDGMPCCAGSAAASLKNAEDDDAHAYPHAESADGVVLAVEDSQPSLADDTHSQCLVRYPTLNAWRTGADGQSWPCRSRVRQIAAYETGFVILYDDDSVYTLGDPRYEDCLGRDVSEASPATEPGHVSDLADLDEPIIKVVGGGFAVGALTESGSLYIWGAESIALSSRRQAFPALSSFPNYLVVDGDKDVKDVAFGDAHAIAVTTDGSIYVIGENTNGQLGLGKDSTSTDKWTLIELGLPVGSQIVGVTAGPRSSLIMTTSRHASSSGHEH